MDWREDYKRKLCSPQDAAAMVKSGDLVHTGLIPMPRLIAHAIVARRDEFERLYVTMVGPEYDPGFLVSANSDKFSVTVELHIGIGTLAIDAMDERRIDYSPVLFSTWFKPAIDQHLNARTPDVFLCTVSPPDQNGYCSFGSDLWNKRTFVKLSHTVLAEVDERFIRTYGDNYIHVSEIDAFVENTPQPMHDEELNEIISAIPDAERRQELTEIASKLEFERRRDFIPQVADLDLAQMRMWAAFYAGVSDPGPKARSMAEFVTEMVPDGATIQIGTGTPSTLLPTLGAFDDKHDLGIHSEMAAPGLIDLIDKGIVNGRYSNTHPGVARLSALTATNIREQKWAEYNPKLELLESKDVVNIREVSQIDKMFTINNALSVDLGGQTNSETVFGGRLVAGSGGQTDLHIGATQSKGGRGIILLRSTALGGSVSRIVPQFEEGAIVTIPRTFADIVITEYGVAQLMGKSNRQRAEELISVAHPDFRAELRREAQRLLYP